MKNQNRLSDKEVSLSIDILESVLNWYKGLSAVRKLNAKQEKFLDQVKGERQIFATKKEAEQKLAEIKGE